MNTKRINTLFAAVIASSPAMLAVAKTPTASQTVAPTNILMGSRADVPYRSDTPITLSDNRLAFSRVGLRSSRGSVDASGAELSALDDDKSSSVSLPADGSTSLEIQFIGQPRWINEIEIDGTLDNAVLEVLNTDGRWLAWSDRWSDAGTCFRATRRRSVGGPVGERTGENFDVYAHSDYFDSVSHFRQAGFFLIRLDTY